MGDERQNKRKLLRIGTVVVYFCTFCSLFLIYSIIKCPVLADRSDNTEQRDKVYKGTTQRLKAKDICICV